MLGAKTLLRTLGLFFVFITCGLFLDSNQFLTVTDSGQQWANGFMIVVFLILFVRGTNRARELMLYALLIGIAGECLFSLGLEMYTYRLENVPIYVPPGHAIVYIATFYFTRESFVKRCKKQFEFIFVGFMAVYAILFLVLFIDVFGFMLTCLILFILRNKPRERLFYCTMYVVVAFLEIVGTNFKCWAWPSTAFDSFSFLPSANPPSGISFFYFGLDLGSLWLYKQRHRIAWGRMKTLRARRL